MDLHNPTVIGTLTLEGGAVIASNEIAQANSSVVVTDTGADGKVAVKLDGSEVAHFIPSGIQADVSTFNIRTSGGSAGITIYDGGGVRLFHNASNRLETSATGIKTLVEPFVITNIYGETSMVLTGNGSNAFYYNNVKQVETISTGLQAAIAAFDIKTSGGEDGITINNNAAVELFHNNTQAFATVDPGAGEVGIDIFPSDPLRITMNSGGEAAYIYPTSDNYTIECGSYDSGSNWSPFWYGDPNGSLDLYHDGVKVAETTANGITGAVWG